MRLQGFASAMALMPTAQVRQVGGLLRNAISRVPIVQPNPLSDFGAPVEAGPQVLPTS